MGEYQWSVSRHRGANLSVQFHSRGGVIARGRLVDQGVDFGIRIAGGVDRAAGPDHQRVKVIRIDRGRRLSLLSVCRPRDHAAPCAREHVCIRCPELTVPGAPRLISPCRVWKDGRVSSPRSVDRGIRLRSSGLFFLPDHDA